MLGIFLEVLVLELLVTDISPFKDLQEKQVLKYSCIVIVPTVVSSPNL